MATITDPLSTLHKVGPSVVKHLAKLAVHTIGDLLLYFPYKYLDYTKFTHISAVVPGETVTVRGVLKTINSRFSFNTRKMLVEAIISDDTGSLKVIWFNQGYLAKTLSQGDEVLLSGKVDNYKGLQLVNPVHEKITEEMLHTGRLVPVYKLPDELYNRTFRGIINQALQHRNELSDDIPTEIRVKYDIPALKDAVLQLHFPESRQELERAQFRMIFEEILVQQLAVLEHKKLLSITPAPSIPPNIDLVKNFLSKLPFELTIGQKKALWQILQDLELPNPMNRLLEGDVGSGKTLVALISALTVADAGFQTVLLAPTEILAKQHFDNFCKLAPDYSLYLLTRNFHETNSGAIPKAKLIKQIGSNSRAIIVGTHAVLSDKVHFNNLGYIIIDEQHRFGVQQRSRLISIQNGGKDKSYSSHLLSMSATPIPRTLALSMYSDLAVSQLTELPKGRQSILTKVVPEAKRADSYAFIEKELQAGRQAFIITPLVEESEKLTIKSVKAEYERLQTNVFPNRKLGLLYGSMKGVDKDKVMNSFAAGELDILVATSVIEIGIDVPNATVIVIESAERFGLAQLHQLRGRVGRGQHRSYCFLFTESLEQKTLQRLQFFSSTSDGFKLAEMDLEQRGFGSLFGTEQTGFDFRFSKFLTIQVLKLARNAAEYFFKAHKLQNFPTLHKKVQPLVEQIHLE